MQGRSAGKDREIEYIHTVDSSVFKFYATDPDHVTEVSVGPAPVLELLRLLVSNYSTQTLELCSRKLGVEHTDGDLECVSDKSSMPISTTGFATGSTGGIIGVWKRSRMMADHDMGDVEEDMVVFVGASGYSWQGS